MVEQAASPFKIGDTVRIAGPMYTGQVGELVVIDPENIESCDFFCVYLDSVEKVVPFAADELERVENVERTLDSYNLGELKDYIRGFYAIPLSDFTREDRTHLQAATKLLCDKGYDVQLRKGHKVVFPRVKE